MRNPRLITQLGYLGLAAVDTYLAGRPGKAARRARFVTKPLLMPTLTATTELASKGQGGGMVRGVQAAQVFSWGGDVALMGRSESRFLAGVASFLGAHVAYVAAFARPLITIESSNADRTLITWIGYAGFLVLCADGVRGCIAVVDDEPG